MRALPELSNDIKHYPDCCVGVSEPMVEDLRLRLPLSPALILSIGCGSGMLEALLHDRGVNIYGVEVPSCENKYLPNERFLRVQTTQSVHKDAILASTVLFVYPRSLELILAYARHFTNGALDEILWLGHQSDAPDYRGLLTSLFESVTTLDMPGMAPYECLLRVSCSSGPGNRQSGIHN